MAIFLNSDGLNNMFVRPTSSSSSPPPVGGIAYNSNYLYTLGGTYDAIFNHIGISQITSSSICLRRDTQNSTIGLDTEGLRGFSNRTSPKIGQYIIKAKGESAINKGGTYIGIKRYSAYYTRYYILYNHSDFTEDTNCDYFVYRYA